MMSKRASIVIAVLVVIAGAVVWFVLEPSAETVSGADANDDALVALGRRVYAKACASCHGAQLEGEKEWRERKPDGTFGATPHDATGHTWHHPDKLPFRITKYGGAAVAPVGFRSGMPAFKDQLSDREVWAVLAFIKSRWPKRVRKIHDRINARSRNRN